MRAPVSGLESVERRALGEETGGRGGVNGGVERSVWSLIVSDAVLCCLLRKGSRLLTSLSGPTLRMVLLRKTTFLSSTLIATKRSEVTKPSVTYTEHVFVH